MIYGKGGFRAAFLRIVSHVMESRRSRRIAADLGVALTALSRLDFRPNP